MEAPTRNDLRPSPEDAPQIGPRADLWASLLLLVAGIFFFSDFLFSSKNFYFRDILNFHYPLRKTLIDAYARGELPLWNPFIYLGQPMLANPNYMAFYPTNLLHVFLSFNYAFKLHFIVHPLLGGLGIYFLQRRLGIAPMAAFGGAACYQFSGAVLSFLNLYNIIPAVGLMPWIAWAFLGALRSDWLRRSLLFGFLLALQVIALEPLIFQCNVWILGGITLFHVLEAADRKKSFLSAVRVGALGGSFAVLLSAAQVIPTLELLPRSARSAGYGFDVVSGWSMHPLDFINVLIPDFFGNPYTINRTTYWGEVFHNGREGYLVSFFLGGVSCLIAGLSFFSPRRKLKLVLAGLAIASAFLALGRFNPIYSWLFDYVPLFRLGRYPSKYILFGTLAFSILVALGLEVLLGQRKENRRHPFVSVAATGLIASLLCAGVWVWVTLDSAGLEGWIRSCVDPALGPSKDYSVISSQIRSGLRSTAAFFFAGSCLILLSIFSERKRILAGLLTSVMLAELIPSALGLSPLISDADVSFVSGINEYIVENGPQEPYRIVPPTTLKTTPDLELRAPNRSSAWLTLFYRRSGQPLHGITNKIQYSLYFSIDHLSTRESDVLLEIFLRLPQETGWSLLGKINSPMLLSLGELNSSRLQLLNKFDTRSNWNVHIYWLNEALSRAYFVSGVRRAHSQEEALDQWMPPEFPFWNTVVLESEAHADRAGEDGAGTVRLLEYSSHRVSCEVEAKVPGFLVLLDSYYPGWHAYVDGRESPILRANYAFRAVEVPAGRHRLQMRYEPWSVKAGMTISFVTLLAGTVLMFRRRQDGEGIGSEQQERDESQKSGNEPDIFNPGAAVLQNHVSVREEDDEVG